MTGASSGIGEQMAILLALRGYEVVLVARREVELQRVAHKIGTGCDVFACDLSSDRDTDHLLERWPETFILVNGAGSAIYGYFFELDWAQQHRLITLNINATVRLCHHYLRGMIARGEGRILNVASTAGEKFAPYYSTYVGTKAFILQFSRSLALELPHGVSISCLIPGPTETEFHRVAGMRSNTPNSRSILAAPRLVAEFGIRLMEDKALSGSPGVLNNIKRFIKWMIPERIWASIIKRRMKRFGIDHV